MEVGQHVSERYKMPSKKTADIPSVYNIPSELPFLDILASGITNKYQDPNNPLSLAKVLILLPTRRACRTLRKVFLKHTNGQAILLPKMVPIGDIDENIIQLSSLAISDFKIEDKILPSVGDIKRRLLLTKLLQESLQKKRIGTERSYNIPVDRMVRLAGELAELLDQVQTERLDFANLINLVPNDYATHWQLTLEFLSVLTGSWPKLLAQEEAIDPVNRWNQILSACLVEWKKHRPISPIIAAGSTGSIPATVDLLSVIARLPNGAVVLPGLDNNLDEKSWGLLEPSHPQYGLKKTLAHIGIPRKKVFPWVKNIKPRSYVQSRSKLVSMALIPASETVNWSKDQTTDPKSLKDFTRIDCMSSDEEAGVIALIMRSVLNDKNKNRTAALVTPDRNLARRVTCALARWELLVEDSGGISLSETAPAIFFRLTAEMALRDATSLPLLSVLKHQLAACGCSKTELNQLVQELEIKFLRGPRTKLNLQSLASEIHQKSKTDSNGLERLATMVDFISSSVSPFRKILNGPPQLLSKFIIEHIRFTELLAKSDLLEGKERLWQSDAASVLSTLMTELIETGHILGTVSGNQYLNLINSLFSGHTVPSGQDNHPRLAILGPLESRLHFYDVMILGGLNEGTWPNAPDPDPWMSRPMRSDFGLSQPERRTGLSAHDFTQALGAPQVFLTRSQRVDGAPTVPTRWLTRMEFFIKHRKINQNNVTKDGFQWLKWQRSLSFTESKNSTSIFAKTFPPKPTPPLEARPRKLSVTEIETWMRDPYSIYAKHILGLRALMPIDHTPDPSDYGNIIHSILHTFLRKNPSGPLSEKAIDEMLDIGKSVLSQVRSFPTLWSFWSKRFEKIAPWFIEMENLRREQILTSYPEKTGSLLLNGPAGLFEITARADRINHLKNGKLEIIDFKTGPIPRNVEVEAGFSPQLPLEAAIAINGNFKGVPKGAVITLEFWRLRGGNDPGTISSVGGDFPENLANDAKEGLQKLINSFDDPQTPYESRPRANVAPRFSDYEHLARVKEWSETVLQNKKIR